jgi:hypothetical protein
MASGETTRDLGFMERSFAALLAQQVEFPIKVEGAKTMPYTAMVQGLDPERRTFVLKLYRPLPPALAVGAWFDLVFSVEERRYEGRIALLGRDGYLRYQFEWPQALVSSDRRVWKRYSFRPRENVYVTAQDTATPCHGITGPLTTLSQGGFSMRVDRVIQLEDGVPMQPRAVPFERGQILSLVRVHGLFREEVLEARGVVARFLESDSEFHLAAQFSGLDAKVSELLSQVLAGRERPANRTGAGSRPAPRSGSREGIPAETDQPAEAESAPIPNDQVLAAAGAGPLRRLDRRTARMLVVAQEAGARDALVADLRLAGFWRLDLVEALPVALEASREAAASAAPYRMLLLDLEAARSLGQEPMGVVRQLEPQLDAFGSLPMALVTRLPEPLLEFLARPGCEAVARQDPLPGRWIDTLDRLAGVSCPG